MQVLLTGGPGTEARQAPPSDDRFAADLRGFGPVGLVAIAIILAADFLFHPASAILVLVWANASHTPWRDIGFVRPKSWVGGLAIGVVFGGLFKLVMKTIVMPLLGADPVNHAYHYLAGNRGAIPATLFLFIVGAGFGEETLYRGFLFERFGKALGTDAGAKTLTVLLTSAWFALGHYPLQGLAGSEQAMVTGLVFGTIYARSGRLWMLMCAHAAYDLAAYAMIYWNLETSFAHLIFK